MTIVEKRKVISKLIEKLPEENLDEAIVMMQDLVSKDKKRTEILLDLLDKEKALFERLAQ